MKSEHQMTTKQIWLITGAGRGMGVEIARAALAAGHSVVATGRDPKKVAAAIGDHDSLLAVRLDITRPEDAQTAVQTAVWEFGRIDVLVNNAGNFYAGFFEELGADQVRSQIETLLLGPMNVTRAVLPVMRKQRSGLLVTISSTAGITGQLFCTAYAAAKFGIEGWMESLTPEVAPFGIRTMLVEPGFFRTQLLSAESTTFAKPSIDDYAKKTVETVNAWSSMDGKQGGDPTKLAKAIVQLSALSEPPARFAAGADAVQVFEAKANALLAQANAHRDLSCSLAHDEV
jgi:NAD(P)-dependent dehydrogenase (short-subunit alcohol dehydrogenase family)